MVTRTNKNQDEDKPSKRFSLISEYGLKNYNTSKYDELLYNFYVEEIKREKTKEPTTRLVKRPGCVLDGSAGGAGVFRGCYAWGNNLYIVLAAQLWTYNLNTRTATLNGAALVDTSGPVGWTEHVIGTTQYLILQETQAMWYIVDGAPPVATRISDPQFPNPCVPTPVSLDGYLFVISNGRIYNSDLGSITSWSDQYIVPELYPDSIRAIKKHNNQILAFSEWSVEFFHDAANTSSSPLGRTEGTTYQLGSGSPWGIASAERYIIFPSQSKSAGRAVHMFNGFQLEKISTDPIEKSLSGITATDWYANTFGDFLRLSGHLFYILSVPNITFVYDVESEHWAQWTWNNSGAHSKWLFDRFVDSSFNNSIYAVNATDKNVYKISPQYTTDNTINIIAEVYTRPYDSETWSRKFMPGMYIISNKPGTTTNCSLRWSDDDKQTWSNTKTIDLNGRGFFPRLGAFRRRSFNLKVISDTPVELEALEFVDNQTGNN
jgi:hypothetical protein